MRKRQTEVMSFAVDGDLKARLLELDHHTVFIRAVVSANLGRCPVCDGQWKRVKEEKTDDGSGSTPGSQG